MEALRLYLDSVFAAAPNTEEVRRVKAELLDNMEEKYHELKSSGVSENEAIGAVISDFGNVDELFVELGITATTSSFEPVSAASTPAYPTLSSTQIDTFIDTYKRSGRGIGLGVLLIILGVVQMVLLFATVDGDLGALPVALLFLFVTPAVGLIIHSSMKLSNFEDIDEGRFRLDAGVRSRLKVTADELRNVDSRKVIVAVSTILTAVMLLVLASSIEQTIAIAFPIPFSLIAVAMLLLAAGTAASILITHFMERGAYDKLLQRGDYAPENREREALIGAIAGLYWPLAVAIYLAWSFAFDAWDISWIIWPVAGILFGGLAAFTSEIKKGQNTE